MVFPAQIRFYRLYADSAGKNTQLPDVLDKGGHGTHVAGSLVGESLGDNAEFNGMAPSAKIAFHDLGNAQATRGIQTPYDLQTGYFRCRSTTFSCIVTRDAAAALSSPA